MPRKAPIDATRALHHIMVRGIKRRCVISDDQGQNNFIELLVDNVTESNTLVWGGPSFPYSILSKKLGVSQPSVSISAKRGESIANPEQFELVEG